LGIGNKINQSSPQQILFFKNPEEIISVSCGNHHCVCVCKNGVFSWGDNYYGQLGIGNKMNQSFPQQILFFKNPEEIISLSCGSYDCVCVCKNGVFSWGENDHGQLGIGNIMNQSFPQQILFFKNPEEIIFLSCGDSFCVCVCKNGVFSWGRNNFGQLGIGNKIDQSSPQQILFFKNPEEIISVSCGGHFSICICKNGVFSWGYNYHGELGIGNKIDQSSPQQITFFENPEKIISFSCGINSWYCICKNGVFVCGRYTKHLGTKKKIYRSSPKKWFPKGIIDSYLNLSFPKSSTYLRREKKILLALIREYSDPDQHLLGKYYLPLDLFKTFLKLI